MTEHFQLQQDLHLMSLKTSKVTWITMATEVKLSDSSLTRFVQKLNYEVIFGQFAVNNRKRMNGIVSFSANIYLSILPIYLSIL